MYFYRFILSFKKKCHSNECLIMGGGYACVGVGDRWRISILPSKFCSKPKTSLKKKKVSLLKKRHDTFKLKLFALWKTLLRRLRDKLQTRRMIFVSDISHIGLRCRIYKEITELNSKETKQFN